MITMLISSRTSCRVYTPPFCLLEGCRTPERSPERTAQGKGAMPTSGPVLSRSARTYAWDWRSLTACARAEVRLDHLPCGSLNRSMGVVDGGRAAVRLG